MTSGKDEPMVSGASSSRPGQRLSRRRAIQRLGCGALAAAASAGAARSGLGAPAPGPQAQEPRSDKMTGKQILFARELPVRHEVDVMVAGGGPAGVAAAIAAARQGAKVFLAEGEVCFGGMGTAGGLPLFCSFTDGVNFVAGGVGKTVYDRLHEAGAVKRASMRANRDVYYDPEPLKRIYDDLATDAGVQFTFGTHAIDVECEDGWVRHVVCAAKSGLFAVRARAYVDATGDGDLAAWAGAPFEKGDEHGLMQAGTFASMWAGIDWEAAEAAGCGVWRQSHRLGDAIRDGVFTVPEYGIVGILPTGRTTGNGNLGHLFGIDGTDERTITPAAVEGRKKATEFQTYFSKYLKGYEGIELVTTASRVGIRETRRILGDYLLNGDDYWARAVFDDEIGRFAYVADVHGSLPPGAPHPAGEGARPRRKYRGGWLPDGESYGIPYRSLTPKGLKNVLTAGRCISADRYVLGSLRVMPGCFITGQAAGVAAALAAGANTDTRSIAAKDLQRGLLALGAYLPNARV